MRARLRTPIVIVPVHVGTIRTFRSVLATKLAATTMAGLGGVGLGVATERILPYRVTSSRRMLGHNEYNSERESERESLLF
jgi:hypothetical protein